MPRRKPFIKIFNFGRYTTWNKTSRELPKILEYTQTIEAINGNEFGIIIDVKDAKSKVLDFVIKHPPIKDDNGNLLPQFKGHLFVKTHNTQFFVGDGIWLPVEDKVGAWEVLVYMDGKLEVSKKFEIVKKEK